MAGGGGNPEEAVRGELGRHFEGTPIFWIVTIAGLISTPLSLLSQYGFHWIAIFLFFATSFWWYSEVWKPKRRLPGQLERHANSLRKRLLFAILPVCSFVAFLVLVWWRVSGLELFRQEYDQDQVELLEHGTVTKYFGEGVAERTTPAERSRHDRDDWIRLLEKGAQSVDAGADMLFIRAKRFDKNFQTFTIEVHCAGNSVAATLHGVGFLVHDPPGGGDNRIYREIPCRPDPDGQSRLYRVDIQRPNSGEEVWLFLSVKPVGKAANFDALNLQLTVYR
ncbi:hypothetical protein [Lacipirellula sp.]|uniref:hypothetical protein n=1 Tax=Lacipirellula sp. TaxID=2691419 RepID=UPI003D113A15